MGKAIRNGMFLTQIPLIITTFSLSTGFLFHTSSLTITNNIGGGLWLKCLAAGYHLPGSSSVNLPDGQKKRWSFEYSLITDKLIWCDILTDDKKVWYNNVVVYSYWKWGTDPEWNIERDGIYRWKHKTLYWFGEEKWVREYDEGDMMKDPMRVR